MENNSYNRITLHVGGNNCSQDGILESYEKLIIETKRVSNNICISSLCTRTRSASEDNKIRCVNGKLKQLTAKHKYASEVSRIFRDSKIQIFKRFAKQ